MAQNLDFATAVVQMRPVPGNVRQNLKEMIGYINSARRTGIKFVVFPELCVSGYLLGDRWEYDGFIREIEKANEELCRASQGMTLIWGSILADWNKIGEDGRVRKYNAAILCNDGKPVTWVPKTNLPKYRIFDDARHFYSGILLAAERGVPLSEILQPVTVRIEGQNTRIALAVCEDLWEDEYITKPSVMYRDHADIIIDISASPWTAEKWKARDKMLKRRTHDSGLPILYVNGVGLQNNGKNLVWFDGDSTFMDENGRIVWRAPQHKEGMFTVNLENPTGDAPAELNTGITEIHGALIPAIREFNDPFPYVVIGTSGGVDSAVALGLHVEALGSDRVVGVNMPTQYNSKTTQALAAELARRNGVAYRVVPIQSLYEEQLRLLGQIGFDNPVMLVKENVQARIRCQQLASIAQCLKGVFTNNGNKTEVALNYFTLYADAAGCAAFLGDLWKGQVYDLARFFNDDGWISIPQGIIDIIPSAELSEAQNVDEGKGDPIFYPYHDPLLKMFTERRWDPTTVIGWALRDRLEEQLGCPAGTIGKYFPSRQTMVDNLEWAWRQYNMEFKRVQLPPVFLTSRRAFGFDRRDTIAASYLTDEYYSIRKQYLARTGPMG